MIKIALEIHTRHLIFVKILNFKKFKIIDLTTFTVKFFIVIAGAPHRASRDTTICGYEVPKDSVVISNLWGVLHDPEVWSDPDMFKPERFLDDARVKIPKEWIPFSIGIINILTLNINYAYYKTFPVFAVLELIAFTR